MRPPKHIQAGNFPSARGWSRGLSKQVLKPLVSTLALSSAASGSQSPNWISRVPDPCRGWPCCQPRGLELWGNPGVASWAG